eukprot:gnl/Spiro4/14084_TR7561_c0_g1_i1.p1 gnl/Spiro4/14084_TR7561_c0_g1~~gnl/Spiro4/14084_TR7561_c0_g1_i1.p1  ORF type:complete len:297 (+),score=31.79 gnl/Spiro4/14084_TR7561_c0_g1_i1:128-1018(+)
MAHGTTFNSLPDGIRASFFDCYITSLRDRGNCARVCSEWRRLTWHTVTPSTREEVLFLARTQAPRVYSLNVTRVSDCPPIEPSMFPFLHFLNGAPWPPREAPRSVPPPGIDFSVSHPLHRTWTMYFDYSGKRVSAAHWCHTIKKIADISTVEDFWCLHNNIAFPTKLPSGSNYHFFKHDIKPEWEDPSNQRGGKWVFHFTKPQRNIIDDLWLNTLLALIGEMFDFADDICGAVVSLRRANNDRISLWTRSASNEQLAMAIGHQIRANVHLPPGMALGYESHDDSKSSNKAKYLYHC